MKAPYASISIKIQRCLNSIMFLACWFNLCWRIEWLKMEVFILYTFCIPLGDLLENETWMKIMQCRSQWFFFGEEIWCFSAFYKKLANCSCWQLVEHLYRGETNILPKISVKPQGNILHIFTGFWLWSIVEGEET